MAMLTHKQSRAAKGVDMRAYGHNGLKWLDKTKDDVCVNSLR